MNAKAALKKLKKSSRKLLKNINKYGKTHPKSIEATKVFRNDREYLRAMSYLEDTNNNPPHSVITVNYVHDKETNMHYAEYVHTGHLMLE